MILKTYPILKKTVLFSAFVFFYLAELVKANLELAYQILRPGIHVRPAIVKLPVMAGSNDQLLTLFNLLTMTPGSLCIDVSPDRKYLYIHVLNVDDRDAFIMITQRNFVNRIQKLFEE